jgi:hypothetical protein
VKYLLLVSSQNSSKIYSWRDVHLHEDLIIALNVDIFTAVLTFICNSHRFDWLVQVLLSLVLGFFLSYCNIYLLADISILSRARDFHESENTDLKKPNYYNMTPFFSFVNKRAICRLGINLISTCAGAYVVKVNFTHVLLYIYILFISFCYVLCYGEGVYNVL